MEIIYTNDGIPVASINNTLYFFNSQNAQMIVGELILDQELSSSIEKNIISQINNFIDSNKLNEFSSAYDIRMVLSKFSSITSLGIVADIVDDANNTREMLSTYKEFPSWQWDNNKREWIPPHPYPENSPDDTYRWDEKVLGWVPNKEKPYNSWVWSDITFEYVPPIPYPADASENEFVWDEDRVTWALNE